MVKNRKSEHCYCILHIGISLSTNFQLKMKTFDFLDQIYLKRMFLVENGKVNVLNIWISLGTEFHLKLTSLMFWIKSSQKGISCLKQKSEHHHWILHIRISLGTKFHFKQIWNLGPVSSKNGTSVWKWKKWTSTLNSAYSN